MNESKVEKQVVASFEKLRPNIWYMKTQGNMYTKNGAPDYTGTYNGQGFGVETKAGNGHKLSMVQLHEGLKLAQAGALFVVAYPDFVDLDTAMKNAEPLPIPETIINSKTLVTLSSEDYAIINEVQKSISSKGVTRSFIKKR